MKDIKTEDEAKKLKIKQALEMFKQEMKENEKARLWYHFLLFGAKLKFWKLEDSLEDAVKIMSAFNQSFQERLSYVV